MNRLSIMAMLVAVFFVSFAPAQADATPSRHISHHHKHFSRVSNNYRSAVMDAAGNTTFAMADEGAIIGSRPAGCPHAYCGCGLRTYLGLSDKRLNLASNWARLLPREAGPRAGVAAVRNHHVMYIEGVAGNGQWLVRDYNSGGGLSRVHVRDVRGYVFVNPQAMARQ